MAKFLNSTALNYRLEELINAAKDRLILISPYLKFSSRLRELIEDKDRLKIDIRIIYGKTDLQKSELKWLKTLNFTRVSFCKNLHAKCYMNEDKAIITSLNLYEFSQVNNNEMGIFLTKETDTEAYKDTYQEAKRLIRISDDLNLSNQKPTKPTSKSQKPSPKKTKEYEKLPSSKIAQKCGLKTPDFLKIMAEKNYLEINDKTEKHQLTEQGKKAGGVTRTGRMGFYFLWPIEFIEKFSAKAAT